MLIAACLVTILAAFAFALDWASSNWKSLSSLALALFASGVALRLASILHHQGKF